MLHLIKADWGWLFGALVIGVIVGGAAWHRVRERWMHRAAGAAAALVGVGVLVAVLGRVHGRAGHRLDLALSLIFCCAVGYMFGWLMRNLSDVPPLAEAGWPAAPSAPDGQLRPPYLSKPGQIPWAVVVRGPEAVAAWTAAKAGRSVAAGGADPGPQTTGPAATGRDAPAMLPQPPAPPYSPPPPAVTTVEHEPLGVMSSMAADGGGAQGRPAAGSSTIAPQPPAIAARSDGAASVPAPSHSLEPSASAQGLPIAPTPVKPDAVALPEAVAPATPDVRPVAPAATPSSDAPEPAPSPPVPDEDKHGGTRPAGLVTARGGLADDLTRIKGIGPQNKTRLHDLGIWHFAQMASWTPDNVHWVGSYLAFPGRIDREKWVEQAAVLAAGGASAKDHPAKSRPRR